jgi:hypothetical protein
MFTDFLDECRAHKLAMPKTTPMDVINSLKDYELVLGSVCLTDSDMSGTSALTTKTP